MKNCPICGASCFDDMEVCYGCLHRFDGEADESKRPSEEMSEALSSSKLLKLSFGESGTQHPVPNPCLVSDAPRLQESTRDEGRKALSDGVAPRPHKRFVGDLPSPAIAHGGAAADGAGSSIARACDGGLQEERANAVVLHEEERVSDEWVMRIAIPSGCDGVTVRLERG